jgi:hypothetical protein
MLGNLFRKPLIALLLLFLAQFLLLFQPEEMAWDGVFYYTYTRSVVCDGDLEMGNDLLLFYDTRDDPYFEDEHFEDTLTPTGRVDNPFAIGVSLLWLPWFALIYVLVHLAGWIGLGPTTLTCYEWPFVWGMATVTCVYGWISVVIGFRLAEKVVKRWIALIASAVVMFTTPLLYYQFREPFYAHAASAMTTALFVYAWWRFAEREDSHLGTAFLLGMLGGLTSLVRTQNIVYLVLPVLTVLFFDKSASQDCTGGAGGYKLLKVLLIVVGGLFILTLQFSVWCVFYGQPLAIPQGVEFMDWSAPWTGHVLFSSFHGLLPWLPLVVPAILGLLLSARRLPGLAVPLLVAFSLQVYVNSCVRDWFGGGGYGARRFSNTLVILLVGYACLIAWRKERWYRLSIVALGGLFVLHQWLILSYGFADGIGGHVVSMKPTYEFHADSIGKFTSQLVGYAPRVLQDPIRTLVLSGSPLATTRTFTSSLCQILLLVGLLGALYALRGWYRRLASRHVNPRAIRRFWLFCIVALTLLADWWLLACA